MWASKPRKFGSIESRREYVTDALDGVHFVYRFPDAMVSVSLSLMKEDTNKMLSSLPASANHFTLSSY